MEKENALVVSEATDNGDLSNSDSENEKDNKNKNLNDTDNEIKNNNDTESNSDIENKNDSESNNDDESNNNSNNDIEEIDSDTATKNNDDKTESKKESDDIGLGLDNIPDSFLNYREEESNTSYTSDDLTDYSNSSLATTQDSSGSTLCVHNNKVNPLNDPIIQEMFKQRTVEMDKVEEERRKRMYTMMRYSKKYKHMLIERANYQWDKNNNDIADAEKSLEENPNDDENTCKYHEDESKHEIPSWCEKSETDNSRNLKKKSFSSNFGIDLHDLDLIDMELNSGQNNENENNNEDEDETKSSDDEDETKSSNDEDETKSSNDEDETKSSDNDDNVTYSNVKIYNNSNSNNEIKYTSILKSNSKNSNSSSDASHGELIKSNNKYSSILVNGVKNSDSTIDNNYIDDNYYNIMNDKKQNSIGDYRKLQINNFMDSENKKQKSFGLFNDKSSNKLKFFHTNSYNSVANNSQTKNMKKHKKLKLFKLRHNHKIKNKLEIDDTDTFRQVSFDSKTSISYSLSNINSSLSLSSSNNDDNSRNSVTKNEKKKKYHGFINFFLNKKHSKSNNSEEPQKSHEIIVKQLSEDNGSTNIISNKENTFKKTKSIRFSDSVNIIL